MLRQLPQARHGHLQQHSARVNRHEPQCSGEGRPQSGPAKHLQVFAQTAPDDVRRGETGAAQKGRPRAHPAAQDRH